MKINLKYGRDGLDIDLDDRYDTTVFRTGDMPVINEPLEHLRKCLDDPLGTPAFKEMARGKRDACIVVSDITRPVPNKVLLPPMLEILEGTDIPREDIKMLVATGIHRKPTAEELNEMLGDDIIGRYPIYSHDARDPAAVTRIGHSSHGVPIDINRMYLESDFKIVISLVEPHFMAGYSGGRKSIAIGLTSVEAVKHLHGTKFLEHPGARNCKLAGNPLHEELKEIVEAAGADFSVNAVIDAGRRIGGVFCGAISDAHTTACEFAKRYCVVQAEQPFDVVITSAAGYPLDTTYYQAVKGLVGGLGILSPGGGIILASECSAGLGSDDFRQVLQRLLRTDDYDEFLKHISDVDNFVIDQWEVEMLVKALRRGAVYLFSNGLVEPDWPLTFARKTESVETAVSQLIAGSYGDTRIAVIPEGPYVIPICPEL